MNNPLMPGCPWYDLHSKFPPNIDWCEEKLCSFILTPFNTWSNIAYLIVAYFMWRKTRDAVNPILKFFSTASVLVGVSSFVFHMSLNFFTQIFDFFGMYLFCTLMLMANLDRMGRWAKGGLAFRKFWIAVFAMTAFTAISVLLHFPIQLYILFFVIGIIRTELMQKVANRRYFWWSLGTLFIGVILSVLDASRLLCWPESHWFQPHGTWHLITAIALYFAFLHNLEQLPKNKLG